jgi:hypothetical protein
MCILEAPTGRSIICSTCEKSCGTNCSHRSGIVRYVCLRTSSGVSTCTFVQVKQVKRAPADGRHQDHPVQVPVRVRHHPPPHRHYLPAGVGGTLLSHFASRMNNKGGKGEEGGGAGGGGRKGGGQTGRDSSRGRGRAGGGA